MGEVQEPLSFAPPYSVHRFPSLQGSSEEGPSSSGQLDTSAPRGGYPSGSPCLLGQPYMAAWGDRRLVVGATKDFSGWDAERAMRQCGPSQSRLRADPGGDAASLSAHLSTEWEAARGETAAMLADAAGMWPPLEGWRVEEIRSVHVFCWPGPII